MKVKGTALPGVVIIEPAVFEDTRGFFMETYQRDRYTEAGIDCSFVQDNTSYSIYGTLRGLHYQHPHSQAKLVQVLKGEVFDVAVDIRRGSPTFGHWVGEYLSEQNKRQMFVPAGFAHGYTVVTDVAVFSYKCSDFYAPECEQGILWSDPDIAISWPVKEPLLSGKDSRYPRLKDMPQEDLPKYIEKTL
ncbi:MAG: dTDP-4-dehydrorhamnose 3,5-epimerase [Deltaproteobacteria bacterium]|nr:dTDP-4-dehydrorhamnose 3,5-epimerase [Deltaproteobacteria bacterium]MBN2688518.1 dTDP-4-dehydrorhamnose 3,5-epimerase [Deltaproteobacteria bacterium]